MYAQLAGKNTRSIQPGRVGQTKLFSFGFLTISLALFFYWQLPLTLAFPLAVMVVWAVARCLIAPMEPIPAASRWDRSTAADQNVSAFLNGLSGCVVLHRVQKKNGDEHGGEIEHVIFRRDGAVFVIETQPHSGTITEQRAEPFLKQAHNNCRWLQEFLQSRIGIKPIVYAAVVFPNADVRARRLLENIDIVGAPYLDRWISKARSKSQVARKLWREIDQIKTALVAQG